MIDKLRVVLNYIFVALIAAMTIYNGYVLNLLNKKIETNTLVLTDSINDLSIDTKGQIKNLEDATKQISKQRNTIVETKEITYVQKESETDADVELKTSDPKLTVKVNDGQKYSFNLLPTEKSKMEDGKLVITQGFSSSIDIRADEYERSKFSLTTAMNSDKKVIGGLHYDLGHTVSASLFLGQGIKPYYGLTYRIGGHE